MSFHLYIFHNIKYENIFFDQYVLEIGITVFIYTLWNLVFKSLTHKACRINFAFLTGNENKGPHL